MFLSFHYVRRTARVIISLFPQLVPTEREKKNQYTWKRYKSALGNDTSPHLETIQVRTWKRYKSALGNDTSPHLETIKSALAARHMAAPSFLRPNRVDPY